MKLLIVYFSKPAFSEQLEKALKMIFNADIESKKMNFSAKASSGKANAESFLPVLENVACTQGYDMVLGITSQNIYAKGFSAIFGLSAIEKRSAIVSTAKLKSNDKKQFFERVLKESIHEVGHLIGLEHCHDGSCAMKCSESLVDCDLKLPDFCLNCEKGKEKLMMKF